MSTSTPFLKAQWATARAELTELRLRWLDHITKPGDEWITGLIDKKLKEISILFDEAYGLFAQLQGEDNE